MKRNRGGGRGGRVSGSANVMGEDMETDSMEGAVAVETCHLHHQCQRLCLLAYLWLDSGQRDKNVGNLCACGGFMLISMLDLELSKL